MKRFGFGRYALYSCVAAAGLLAACGGSQPPIGAPGAMSQNSALQSQSAQRDENGSWMSPAAKGGGLLYVSNDAAGQVLVFTYPQGDLVGTLTGMNLPNGLCADRQGDIFVANFLGSDILEYAHGGTSPIATLADDGYAPESCSIDSITGNLAVTNYDHFFYGGSVAIYSHASGSPTIYLDPTISLYWFCGYDDHGNLYVDGTGASGEFVFSELPAGSGSFTDLSIDEPITNPGAIQWDGRYLALTSTHGFQTRTPEMIYRLQFSGSSVHVVGTTTLLPHQGFWGQSWIEGHTLVQPIATGRSVNFWDYPKGGESRKKLRKVHGDDLFGVAVSSAPSQ